jgi:erythronate-4-phosphate dehydrogenase
MKFIIDDKIPYIQGVLEPFGEVVYLSGPKTTPSVVKDADAIITRTRTICNESLLAGSSVKFIATATIGYDHIDTDYCEKAGISWTNAPGCNSKSVEQYIASALFILAEQKGFEIKDKTIGVVGVGQVGSKVAKVCSLLGMNVLLNDPPRARVEGSSGFTSLSEVLEKADIITLHVPLNLSGEDATYHLADSHFFETIKRRPILFNTCRGEVMDTTAVQTAMKEGRISGLVVDCWENEPDLDIELLDMADLATPHIAGYSKDGKANGTSMSIQSLSRFFGMGLDNWEASGVELPMQTTFELDGTNMLEEEILAKAVLFTYDVRHDDEALRDNPALFEKIRGDYPVRREYPAFTLRLRNVSEHTLEILKSLGFNVQKF